MSFRFIEHHWISLSAQKGLKGVTGKQNIVIELRVLFSGEIVQNLFETYEKFLRFIIVQQERKFNL